jgi:hypothetical protein
MFQAVQNFVRTICRTGRLDPGPIAQRIRVLQGVKHLCSKELPLKVVAAKGRKRQAKEAEDYIAIIPEDLQAGEEKLEKQLRVVLQNAIGIAEEAAERGRDRVAGIRKSGKECKADIEVADSRRRLLESVDRGSEGRGAAGRLAEFCIDMITFSSFNAAFCDCFTVFVSIPIVFSVISTAWFSSWTSCRPELIFSCSPVRDSSPCLTSSRD